MNLLFVILFCLSAGAIDFNFECSLPVKGEVQVLNNCAGKNSDGTYIIKGSVWRKIDFDKKNLAAGSISKDGCYWLNKKGILRKTHCFDNGADYFQEGFARYIGEDGRFGFMNEKLEIKIKPQYTFAFPFQDGIAKVCQNCRIVKSDPEHSVVQDGHWFIIDQKGKTVKDCPEAKAYHECN